MTLPVSGSGTLAAVDLVSGVRTPTFSSQLLDVAWSVSAGTNSGPGPFQTARITLADATTGYWGLKVWEMGSYAASFAGPILPEPVLSGDVNADGSVSGSDLTTIISYWGQTGLGREYGDLDGSGTVDGPDYSEVLTYWGTSLAPGDMGSLPFACHDIGDDGFIGSEELLVVISTWGQSVTPCTLGDFSGDGFVGGDDYTIILTGWGTGVPPEPSTIPDPATLGLLLLGGLALLRRRK